MIQRSVLAEPGNQALHHVHDKLTVCRCQPGKKVMEPAGLVLRAGAPSVSRSAVSQLKIVASSTRRS
ncbi:hypothetical protein AN459_25750 [Pseudomonas aeruginosa]|nr:hypothetical protein G1E_34830 [Pseudomonas sp. TJI-51]KRV19603.1 hypothetical protein AN459_25750 [Pseudomonas aeruginosa]KYC19563.1 hypothetical protein WM94_18185 [Pseudomonas sp. ABFPK]